eukprot:2286330-Alexandrium_andersonii.AAC.1
MLEGDVPAPPGRRKGGLGAVRQRSVLTGSKGSSDNVGRVGGVVADAYAGSCLLYTSDAADDM